MSEEIENLETRWYVRWQQSAVKTVEGCFEEMSRYFVWFVSDVDECSQDETLCSANELCLNDQGTYSCACRSGYSKINNVCVKKGERSKKVFHASAMLSIKHFLVTLSKVNDKHSNEMRKVTWSIHFSHCQSSCGSTMRKPSRSADYLLLVKILCRKYCQ